MGVGRVRKWGWRQRKGTAAKLQRRLQGTYLKLSFLLHWLHLGLIGHCCITLWDALPLHFLHDHHRLPLAKAAGGEHV